MLKKFLVFAALMLLIVSGASAQSGEPIRIGAIFDLSGVTADAGRPYAQGVAAYVDFVNRSGGIDGRPIDLISADYAYDTARAEQLYTQIAAEDVVIFMGWGTADTLALVSRTAREQIPFVSASYSASLNDPNGTAPYNFLIAPTYGDQLEIMMMHMLDLWEDEGGFAADMRVAIFHHDSVFGTDPIAQGTAFARQEGIGGVLPIRMAANATDFSAELQQADDYGVTHIIVQNISVPAALLARNVVNFFGSNDIIVFGCLNWCADEQFISRAGNAAEGALGAIPFTPTTVDVSGQDEPREFLEAQGLALEETSLHFTQGWATMSILVEAIQQTLDAGLELTGPNIRDTMETLEEVETGDILAPVTFTSDDHRASRALAIYQVEDGEWVESSDVIDLRDFE